MPSAHKLQSSTVAGRPVWPSTANYVRVQTGEPICGHTKGTSGKRKKRNASASSLGFMAPGTRMCRTAIDVDRNRRTVRRKDSVQIQRLACFVAIDGRADRGDFRLTLTTWRIRISKLSVLRIWMWLEHNIDCIDNDNRISVRKYNVLMCIEVTSWQICATFAFASFLLPAYHHHFPGGCEATKQISVKGDAKCAMASRALQTHGQSGRKNAIPFTR